MKKVILIFSVLFLFSCSKNIIKPKFSNTKKLCKAWQVISVGKENIEYEYYITFNTEGDYVARIIMSSKEQLYSGSWVWCNSEENKFSFSLEGNTDCESNNIFDNVIISSEKFSGVNYENETPQIVIMKLVD